MPWRVCALLTYLCLLSGNYAEVEDIRKRLHRLTGKRGDLGVAGGAQEVDDDIGFAQIRNDELLACRGAHQKLNAVGGRVLPLGVVVDASDIQKRRRERAPSCCG